MSKLVSDASSRKSKIKARNAGMAANMGIQVLPFKSVRFTSQSRRPNGSISGQSWGKDVLQVESQHT
jgi:hypothetical protein